MLQMADDDARSSSYIVQAGLDPAARCVAPSGMTLKLNLEAP
jgi:hypothetical protein